jgi:hypothetical protein
MHKKAHVIKTKLKTYSKISKINMLILASIVMLVSCLYLFKSLAIITNSIQGDLNTDNVVSIIDLSILLSDYGKGTSSVSNLNSDINMDGTVGVIDLSILLSNYGSTGSGVNTSPSAYGSGVAIKPDCGPVATASDGTMVWYSRGSNNLDDVYIGDSNCNGTALLPAYDGHRAPTDMTRDGRYILLATAVGWDRKTEGAAEGKGSGNAIQVYDRQTGKLSTLLPGGIPSQRGVIWAKLNSTATKIAWAQMVRSPFETGDLWGDWEVHAADVNLATGTLSNNHSWRDPGGDTGIMEAYGWLPNTNKIVFQSSIRSTLGFPAECQLWTLPDNFTSTTEPTRITPPFTDSITNTTKDVFQEFVHFKPGDSNTMYVSVGAQTVGGNDVFAYDLRTANQSGLLAMPKRISYLGGARNKWDLPVQANGWPTPSYKVVTSITWQSSGWWMAAVCPDIYCTQTDAWRFVEPNP